MTSLRPHSNIRPLVIFTSLCTPNADGSTPRSGTLASVCVERLGRLTTTNSSGDTSAFPLARAIPGASPMTFASSRPRMLIISLSAPERMTIAASGAPVDSIVFLNPWPIESTPTSTATTPATPNIAVAAAPLRRGRVRRLNSMSALVCANQFIWTSLSPQCINRVQPHALQCRQESGESSQQQRDEDSFHELIVREEEVREDAGRIAGGDAQPAGREADRATDDGNQERLGEDECQHLSVSKSDRFHHCELAHPFANRLGHRVSGDEQNREEHRRQNRRRDRAEVTDLTG